MLILRFFASTAHAGTDDEEEYVNGQTGGGNHDSPLNRKHYDRSPSAALADLDDEEEYMNAQTGQAYRRSPFDKKYYNRYRSPIERFLDTRFTR